ncbi:MAG: GNAT family N-acetyltransferase [Deltaproteobacteria bacterium]|nr:GNAT family N-acetyltransferase [Deltaproteobacteria bacterium]
MDLHFDHKRFEDLGLRELYAILQLRDEVFVVGQKITAEPEVDGLDPQCVHVMGRNAAGRLVATARLFVDEQPIVVGRVAVAISAQRRGVGTQLMRYVHTVLCDRPARLSAQAHLESWYAALGWIAYGEPYFEANIPHIGMKRPGKA